MSKFKTICSIALISSGFVLCPIEAVEEDISLNEKMAQRLEEMPPDKAAERIITINDKNGDGKLSADEVDTVFRLKRFRKVDLNGDGLLSKDELATSYKNAALARSQRVKENNNQAISARGKLRKGASTFFGGLIDELGEMGK